MLFMKNKLIYDESTKVGKIHVTESCHSLLLCLVLCLRNKIWHKLCPFPIQSTEIKMALGPASHPPPSCLHYFDHFRCHHTAAVWTCCSWGGGLSLRPFLWAGPQSFVAQLQSVCRSSHLITLPPPALTHFSVHGYTAGSRNEILLNQMNFCTFWFVYQW